MPSWLKSPKLQERAEAAAKHLLRFVSKVQKIVLLGPGTCMPSWLKPAKLQERAEAAAKQMRYFRLFSQRRSFDELDASARRAGFEVIHESAFEARFRWAADADHPDFTFYVWRDDPEEVSVMAPICLPVCVSRTRTCGPRVM